VSIAPKELLYRSTIVVLDALLIYAFVYNKTPELGYLPINGCWRTILTALTDKHTTAKVCTPTTQVQDPYTAPDDVNKVQPRL
jgi:hypothetical protein